MRGSGISGTLPSVIIAIGLAIALIVLGYNIGYQVGHVLGEDITMMIMEENK